MEKNKFLSYVWGWITADDTRHPPGIGRNIKYGGIVGIWGEILSKDEVSLYRETYLYEYVDDPDVITSWTKRPLAMLQNLNMEQCLRFVYPDRIEAVPEIVSFNEPERVKTKTWQSWKCKCGHSFYTDPGLKATIRQLIANGLRSTKMMCSVCNKLDAKKSGKVSKPVK